ncbi:MAG: DUF2971 domain-containing protein [Planctomycetia bacterium]|jgi:hypothetical protein
MASIAEPTPEEAIQVYDAFCKGKAFRNNSQLSQEVMDRSRAMYRDEVIAYARDGLTQAVFSERDKFLKKNGVCCFAERNDNLLMWSHYSDSGRGFCLEFRTEHEPFSKLHKVKYVSDIPVLSLYSMLANRGYKQWFDLFCTKSEDWSYEQEWRAFHAEAGTAFGYESQALKAIYFGPMMERQALEIICLILQGQNLDVELWQGHRSESEFKMEFKRVTYTSHVEAKSKREL